MSYTGIRNNQFHKFGKIKSIIKRVVNDISYGNIGLYATQSAFFSVLSAVPFAMLVILCLKYFIDIDISPVIKSVINSLPDEIANYISMVISEIFYRSETVVLLSAAIITVLWSSSRGTMAIYIGINSIYGYTKKRSWLVTRIIAFFYNIIFVLAVVITAVILVFGNTIISFIDTEYITVHCILSFLFKMKYLIFFVLFVLVFAVVYTFLPQRKLSYKKQLAGSVAAASGWIIFSFGFSVYIKHFSKFSFLYGSITAVVILMLWVYFCQYIFLTGALINRYVENGYLNKILFILS